GALMRFYANNTSPVLVDRYESLDAIVEAATENAERRILVDLAAQAQEPVTKWMDESQLLEVAREIGLNIHYWHVMDAGKDSVDLLERLFEQYEQRLGYVVVRNHLRGDDFGILHRSGLLERAQALNARLIDIKRLYDPTMLKIDPARGPGRRPPRPAGATAVQNVAEGRLRCNRAAEPLMPLQRAQMLEPRPHLLRLYWGSLISRAKTNGRKCREIYKVTSISD
ncbi:MAG: hypothetical protein ABSF31_10900, partial [Steroidobacteraceae bacterium]